MTLKKLHENRHLFSFLDNSKSRLRKAILKPGIENELINLLSELCLNLMEGNVQLSEGLRQQTKQHRYLVCTLACQKKGKSKGKRLIQAGGSFFPLLLPVITGLVKTIL
jgi:hypothetical protein